MKQLVVKAHVVSSQNTIKLPLIDFSYSGFDHFLIEELVLSLIHLFFSPVPKSVICLSQLKYQTSDEFPRNENACKQHQCQHKNYSAKSCVILIHWGEYQISEEWHPHYTSGQEALVYKNDSVEFSRPHWSHTADKIDPDQLCDKKYANLNHWGPEESNSADKDHSSEEC